MEIFWQRLDSWLKASAPIAVTLVMTLLSVAAWPLPNLGGVMPPLAFIALFYWSAHRPDLFPSAAAFFIGLLNDVVNDVPLGVSAFLFTMAHQILWRQRRFFAGHSFIILWSGFALASCLLMLSQWGLVALVNWTAPPFSPVFVQTLLGIALFPLPCWVLIQLQRRLLSAI